MTRQWLANPELMCLHHLLGEHAETHMFIKKMEKKYSLAGFQRGSMFFGADFIKFRHDWLTQFIPGHKTPLELTETLRSDYPLAPITTTDLKRSLGVLLARCEACSRLHQQVGNHLQVFLDALEEVHNPGRNLVVT